MASRFVEGAFGNRSFPFQYPPNKPYSRVPLLTRVRASKSSAVATPHSKMKHITPVTHITWYICLDIMAVSLSLQSFEFDWLNRIWGEEISPSIDPKKCVLAKGKYSFSLHHSSWTSNKMAGENISEKTRHFLIPSWWFDVFCSWIRRLTYPPLNHMSATIIFKRVGSKVCLFTQ